MNIDQIRSDTTEFAWRARACAWLAMLLGATVLVGWWTDIPLLTSVMPGYVTMKANTAMGLLLGGFSLWCLAPEPVQPDGSSNGQLRRVAGITAAILCAVIGFVTVLEYASHMRGIDELLVRVAKDAELTATPGRMALLTAFTLLALGCGLATLDMRGRIADGISQWCLAIGSAIPLGVAAGYIYLVIPVRGLGQGLQMAVHTAVGCLAIGVGGFLARPEREFVRTMTSNGTGGLLARRLMPAALGIPIILGALRLAAEASGFVTPAGGGGAVMTATMLLLAWLIWRTASEVDRSERARTASDRERMTALEAQAAAETASDEKTRFLATMSHELRTPLNAIVGFTDLLDAGIYGAPTMEQRDALARVRRSSQHLLGLVDQVLAVARLDTDEAERLDVEEFALDDLISSAGEFVVPECKTRRVRFEILRGGLAGRVRADRRRVEQVLINLIGNAVKFTPAGGRVVVMASSEGDMVVVRVFDTGCGVPPDKRNAIFSPFVQAEAGLTRKRDGAGLGLSISRAFARIMGGDVTLERSDSSGSVFAFRLPRHAPARDGGEVHANSDNASHPAAV